MYTFTKSPLFRRNRLTAAAIQLLKVMLRENLCRGKWCVQPELLSNPPWLYNMYRGTDDQNWISVVVLYLGLFQKWDCLCILAYSFGIGLLLLETQNPRRVLVFWVLVQVCSGLAQDWNQRTEVGKPRYSLCTNTVHCTQCTNTVRCTLNTVYKLCTLDHDSADRGSQGDQAYPR